ncbi:hypothetical protein JG687_00017773 [Phytophthora cactorum]|uniref:Uncharacterized protein n=1 Tax=Phytophthora cactorum TaxID=29920 RepID=A0A8T1TPI6_9STRA|nr:hypothetical protein JG687_00017773 [Phytophthora cactorum]
MWSTTVKPLKIVQLVRNEIPDCKDSDARNVVHDTSELLKKRILQVQEILEGSLDHSTQRYKKQQDEWSNRQRRNQYAITEGAHQYNGHIVGIDRGCAGFFGQLFVMMTQQNQKFQAAIQTQKQQAQAQLELLMLQRRKHYTGTSQAHLANSSRPLLTASVVAWIQRI